MRRAVDQLGPMALSVVSLSIIIGIGSVVLAELGNLSVLSNSTTASDTITAGQEALGTFGDFFTVIGTTKRSPLQVTASTKKDTVCWDLPLKLSTVRKIEWDNQQETEINQDPQRRYVSTHETLGSDFVQPIGKPVGLMRCGWSCRDNLPSIGSSKAYRSTGYGIEA